MWGAPATANWKQMCRGRSLPLPASPPEVVFSNLTKTFWPDDGYTKGDLIDTTHDLAWMLPYRADRRWYLLGTPMGVPGNPSFRRMRRVLCPPGFGPSGVERTGTTGDRLLVCAMKTRCSS